jgi:hypothetical protein
MAIVNPNIAQCLQELKAKSIEEARLHLAFSCGAIGSELHGVCSAYMAAREAGVRDAREEKTLLIASQARSDSNRANTIAVVAMICSAIATIISVIIAAIMSGFLGHVH